MMKRTNMQLLLAAGMTVTILFSQVLIINSVAERYFNDPDEVASAPVVTVAATAPDGQQKAPVYEELAPLPVVLMHGMGDAAGNSGMVHIREYIAKQLGVYVASIQIGNSVEEDIRNSFFITMDAQVEIFAKIIQQDPKLVNGFNAAGFSQGNLLIRAYIERYNNPPVKNFISFHGPLAGVGALPQCAPTSFICKEINRLIGDAVYSKEVQDHIAQSNYFRDPMKIPEYLAHVRFLPDLNNEKETVNATYKANFIQLQSLVLVRANGDTQVFPKESEWFGAYEDGYKHVLGFNETRWYKEDSFGLQTLDKAGKVHFLATEGNHLQFTKEFLLEVVTKYFSPQLAALP